MPSPPVCPSCGSLGVGDRCAQCGTQLNQMQSIAVPGLQLDGAASPAGAPALEQRQRTASAYLALQPSESAVLHAASRIFASFVAAGTVTAENEKEQSDRAVRLATRMALVIERYVQSDNEDW